MPPTVASVGLGDDEFLSAFRHYRLPASLFRHGDHLRFSWLALYRNVLNDALRAVRDGIKQFADHYGAAHICHETITAWVHLLASHGEPTFSAFLDHHGDRPNKELL